MSTSEAGQRPAATSNFARRSMRSAQLLLYASLWQCDPEGAEFFKTIDDKTLYAIHWSTGGLKQGASQEEKVSHSEE